ncbi:histidine phosphotransferase ChpT [Caulobacter mirabilis]|uniref:Histidine phosphotransferase n=1 Tax=Caulobacter mirabilis TaxID=69666 RepID=A0A2D2ASM2_9CAUL|nr:histidine phosphotransferase family protein [Caulobacter mirabilis]ATQ40965.1 histidine phosphotransferase [Caulobacter mirabilis]
MTDQTAAATPAEVSEPAEALPDAAELAAQIAARLCHDFISPASAVVSGLDLLEDPSAQDMREDAMNLIAQSARKLADLLQFSRVAFGASNSAEVFDARELEKLAQGVYAHVRPDLEWKVEPAGVNKPAARILMNLAQIAAGALPMGGKATIRAVEAGDRLAISVEATGPRARLKPEVLRGLQGQDRGEAVGGAWVQAYYLHLIARQAGGRVAAETGEDRVSLAAFAPL